ncbi:heme-binding protein 1 isoform X3 [Fukomys damarensis]|uniref:heme-binding protein 1 isoform X3 n=1 Tax=Fukomys damarensis TaxID=885580 RepID=UPI000540211A|nr:heme-binding protein 1 isoform X3 [Fukomys damarensis]
MLLHASFLLSSRPPCPVAQRRACSCKRRLEDVSYEERACEGGKFATVEVTNKPVDEALREAMPKVMKYVGGTNDKGIGMGMTVPVSFAVFPDEDGSLQKKLKVWFRIPNQFQSNPPVPSDDSIKIEERESITVYSTLLRSMLCHHLCVTKPVTQRAQKLKNLPIP